MKKLTLTFLALATIMAVSANAETSSFNAHGVRSSAQKAKRAKAKCEAMKEAEKKESCLKELEEKSAKKATDSKNRK